MAMNSLRDGLLAGRVARMWHKETGVKLRSRGLWILFFISENGNAYSFYYWRDLMAKYFFGLYTSDRDFLFPLLLSYGYLSIDDGRRYRITPEGKLAVRQINALFCKAWPSKVPKLKSQFKTKRKAGGKYVSEPKPRRLPPSPPSIPSPEQ